MQIAKEQASIWQNIKLIGKHRSVLVNTIVLSVVWTVASFSFYFIEFYMNLVPTNNLYLLSVIIGSADVIGGCLFLFVVQYFSFKRVLLGVFALMTVSAFTLYGAVFNLNPDEELSSFTNILLASLVFLVRFSATISFAMAYYGTAAITPPQVVSTVFSITNVTCRTFTMFAPYIANTSSDPIIYVGVLAILAFISSFFITTDTRNAEF